MSNDTTSYDLEGKITQLKTLLDHKEFDKLYVLTNEILAQDENCAEACEVKGFCLFYGNGVGRDLKAGLEYLIRGAELDNRDSKWDLVALWTDAPDEFKMGDSEIAGKVRDIVGKWTYEIGCGSRLACLTNLMTQDEKNAVDALKSAYKYLCIARSAGVEDAEQQIVSTLIECESYIKQIPDIDHAHEIEMAMPLVEAGSADAMFFIHLMKMEDPESELHECNRWLEMAARNGQRKALNVYGGLWVQDLIDDDEFNADSYICGCEKLQQEKPEYVDAAMLGILGQCYMSDRSSMKNLDKAEQYLTQAAEKGDALSIRLLGINLASNGQLRTNEEKAIGYLNQVLETETNQNVIEYVTFCAADVYLHRNTPADLRRAEALLQRIENSDNERVRDGARAAIAEIRKHLQQTGNGNQGGQGGANPGKKGGCYIATAVYGSYDCPQVWTLRRYRDAVLAQNAFGRLFIRTYYRLSPGLVRRFGNTGFFNRFWRGALDRWVRNLQNRGFENTPYHDENTDR